MSPYVAANKTSIKLVIGWNRDGTVNLALDLSAFTPLSDFWFFPVKDVCGKERETGKKESESWILAPFPIE